MNSSTGFLVVMAVIIILLAAVLIFARRNKNYGATDENTRRMQLAAYERLVLLIDRISLQNLLTRVSKPGISSKELQQLLIENIKQEFDYNVTQQIYVSANAWKAVKNLKEQNQLTVNQIAHALPANATGLDLSKYLLEYLIHDKKGALHEIASEVVSHEAKKLL